MRWPFRRPTAAPTTAPAVSAVPAPVVRPIGANPGRRAWQTLPPLVPVVARPRITVAAPDVTMTRSLLHRPAAPRTDSRPVGRVDGLAEVLPALEVDQSTVAPPEVPRPVVRAVPRPVERPPLTAATSEYVGEAREAAEPYRAPAWLRALSTGPVVDPLFGVMLPGPAQSARPVAAPRPPARPVPTTEAAPRRPLRPRGRLGLGAPLRPDATDAPDAEPEPAAPQTLSATQTPVAPHTSATSQTPAAPAGTPALPYASAVDDPRPPGGGSAIVRPGESRPSPAQPRVVQPSAVPSRLAQPRFVGAAEDEGPVALTHAPRSETRRAAPPSAALVRDVVAATGVDLDRVLVHRGPEVDRQATQLDAAAFAADDRVHLGSVAGHDEGPEARALIAHELVHVAQQRRLGGTVADESSAEGIRLEAEAVAVEQAVRESRPLPQLTNSTPVESRAAGRPAGVLSHPALAGPVPQGVVVRGRVQRRPLDLGHAPSSAVTAQPAAQAPAGPPQTPASPPVAPQTPATPPPTAGQRFSALGEGLASDMGDMVLASWSLDQGHEVSTRGSGNGGGTPGSANGGGNGSTNGSASSGDGRQEQFNRLAQPALERLNEERAARGEHPLATLPPEEEDRIWRQVDQGGGPGPAGGVRGGPGGGVGAGRGGATQQPIRSWHDLGTAVTGDVSDMIGSSFGLDVAELARADSPAAASAAARNDPHHDQHKKIEPDDIDLDELGHRLYDRIRSRLRLELLLDRERAGLLSDFR
jgi:Domain of unknown function (DUF4157)